MARNVSIVVVALGGYGLVYLEGLMDHRKDENVTIVGGVDPEPERCTRLSELRARGVPVYGSLEDFYSHHQADLAIISSPIHLHCEQTCLALSKGSNVLCEKPLGAVVQEGAQMIRARNTARKFVAIGYQWSFTETIQALKRDIAAGLFGAPLRFKTIALWPRDESYYRRNNWAGAQRDPEGRWVLDSPANNALAHYLHNMFYLLGERVDTSARPRRAVAELYRANDIENFDTFAARFLTEHGTEVLFYGSHAVEEEVGPRIEYEFERAKVTYVGWHTEFVARWHDGREKSYGAPDSHYLEKMWQAISAVRTGAAPVCGIEAALAHTLAINGMHESAPEIVDLPREMVTTKGEPGRRLTYAPAVGQCLAEAFERNVLPSEMQVPWAVPGKEINLEGYTFFPGGTSPKGGQL
ncbi:MAG: Gfo/Idh/MocA family oxidoreductase [candidate division KSB1 bacterium]|nr:Gfo/Idh/MocA family oxidoreductase [candidate division KSB1 bacterium]